MPQARTGGATQVAAVPVRSHKTWNRYEIKYLVSQRIMRELLASVGGYVVPDAHGGADGYPVHSVYWDSPRLRFFWEKIEGLNVRRKLRFRTYGESPEIFIEIKQRIDRTLQKRRVRCAVADARRLFGAEGAEADADADTGNPVLSEVLYLCHQHGLRPKMSVAYRRRAFAAVFEPDLRITFDTHVQYHAHELEFGKPFESGRYVVDPRLAIMEVKFNHRVPRWLLRVIARYGLSVTRMSKYCTAVDREYYDHQLT